MKYLIGLIVVCLLIARVGYGQFLPRTEDIPLMKGLNLIEESNFSFDTPSGQILNFEAKTDLKVNEVKNFYQKTLVAMGWKVEKKGTYRRGKDTLKITFPKAGQVHFDITLANGVN